MNIIEIINRMNSGGVIDADELEYFETHYDAGTMPWVDPTTSYSVFYPDALMPEGDGDDYSSINDGDICEHENSWSSNCSDCDESEMEGQLNDSDYEPSIEREGIGW
jgi:hypothetical protein